jgi:alginate O-acetyltransferase complex protein AlgI
LRFSPLGQAELVFSSHIFLYYFLPLALGLYYAAPRAAKNPVLTILSYLFYGWTNPVFIVLILYSTLVDFLCGNFIYGHWGFGSKNRDEAGNPRVPAFQRKIFLALSLISNIGMLLFFKYFMFAQENLNRLREMWGGQGADILMVLLPAGISFYTFESISYNVDIYLGRARPATEWIKKIHGPPKTFLGKLAVEARAISAFACYITQFPHLVAGPIIRYQDLEAQLHLRTHTIEKFARGVFFFALGLGKKILIANPMGQIADAAFIGTPLHAHDAWFGVTSYAFQIYFDFSGYSDMAIGLALMLGYEFFKNFESPYKAHSITDFWRRWHISLSTWLRDYLYIPLGGNRKGPARTYINLIVVMLIGGFWHGASWNFLIWGAIHGAWLAAERRMGKTSFYAHLPGVIRVIITFAIINIAWVFFRAPDLPAALAYLKSMFGANDFAGAVPATEAFTQAILYMKEHLIWFAAAAGIAFFGKETWDLSKHVTPAKAAGAMLVLLWSAAAMATQTHNPFLYLRF